MSEIKAVTDWIDAAKQEPSVRNIANYLAYTMSELSECLFAASNEMECLDSVVLSMHADSLERLSREMMAGRFDAVLECSDKAELMDGAADTAWTAIGLMHMLGDAQGAFAEVVRSNYSKFEGGVCQLDETGKVVKGPSYSKPDLAKFIR